MNKRNAITVARRIVNSARRNNRPALAGVFRLPDCCLITDAFRVLCCPLEDLPGLPVLDGDTLPRSIISTLSNAYRECYIEIELPAVEDLKRAKAAGQAVRVGDEYYNSAYLLDMVTALGPTVRALYNPDRSNYWGPGRPFPGLYFENKECGEGLLLPVRGTKYTA